ncbi:MAG: orotate phosphoribosyltransferase [Bdellovibrio sp.]
MTRKELAQRIYEVAYLRGDFLLRSGQRSSEYFDKYRFEAEPLLLREIARHLVPLIPRDTEILAGLELGGVPIATAISLQTGLPLAFVRKKAKDYGTCRVAEGLDLKARKVLVVEDVITTGGQVLSSVEDLRQLGALVTHVACVIYRGPEAENPLEKASLVLHRLFDANELRASQ